MNIELNLSAETERRFREKAAQIGLALEAYLQRVIERDAQLTDPDTANSPTPKIPQDEWERLLDARSARRMVACRHLRGPCHIAL